jgi:hypothetical protein
MTSRRRRDGLRDAGSVFARAVSNRHAEPRRNEEECIDDAIFIAKRPGMENRATDGDGNEHLDRSLVCGVERMSSAEASGAGLGGALLELAEAIPTSLPR